MQKNIFSVMQSERYFIAHFIKLIFPYYLLVILILMGYMHEALQKKTKAAQ